jgi:hypothetical protein
LANDKICLALDHALNISQHFFTSDSVWLAFVCQRLFFVSSICFPLIYSPRELVDCLNSFFVHFWTPCKAFAPDLVVRPFRVVRHEANPPAETVRPACAKASAKASGQEPRTTFLDTVWLP